MRIPGLERGVARRSELAAGIGERALRSALSSGVLEQKWRGVVFDATCSLDPRTRALGAVLAAGEHAVVSGPTAVFLHGMTAAEVPETHVTVPYSRSVRSRNGLVVHQDRFDPADVVRFDGLPVFAKDFALAELLCGRDRRMAFASLDQALIGCTREEDFELRRAISRRLLLRDDPRGVAQARMLTDLATGKADSPPESSFLLIVVQAGFPVPEAQHEIHTINGTVLYVLDLAWPQRRIALEYDGFVAHEDRAYYDAERDDRLAGRGWIVVRATSADLRDPSRVLAELNAAFAQRS